MTQRIDALIGQVLSACAPWAREKDGRMQFIDPLDGREISAHYGASHAAAAFILWAGETGDEALLRLGETLLLSVLDRWDSSRALPGFHNDFNNFALCVLDAHTGAYHSRIEQAVLSTPDSNHDTVNWLPMRWYVNNCRYRWTGDKRYQDAARACQRKIREATWPDGFIDDRLPRGLSFNLQYDVATVAALQFLRASGEELDLKREAGALLGAVCPDGDINYLGRGCNQIFAWGLWVYLLSSGDLMELDRALSYLEARAPQMLQNNSLMLNDFPGREKYMWWDYHYCSVYTAHFLFWLVLARRDAGKRPIRPEARLDGSSGLRVYRTEDSFAAVFDGRREYLAERGPVVAALWTKKAGMLCKGTFGPWQGTFGRSHMQPEATLRNFPGLLRVDTERDWTRNRLIHRLLPRLASAPRETVRPQLCPVEVQGEDGCLRLTWNPPAGRYMVNLPVLQGGQPRVRVLADGKELPTLSALCVRNAYGWVRLIQAAAEVRERLVLILE